MAKACIFAKADNRKTKTSKRCLFVHNTLPQYDKPICKVSRLNSVFFRSYEPNMGLTRTDTSNILRARIVFIVYGIPSVRYKKHRNSMKTRFSNSCMKPGISIILTKRVQTYRRRFFFFYV